MSRRVKWVKLSRQRTEPSEDGTVHLSVWQAAWLAYATTETVRRWIREETLPATGAGRTSHVTWQDLVDRAAAAGDTAPAHWSWLNEDLCKPPQRLAAQDPTPGSNEGGAIGVLRASLAAAELERDQARADADNLDQAVMAYRDNWRRRTQPQTPEGAGST